MDTNFLFVFKDILRELSNPTMSSDHLLTIFNFLENDVKELYSNVQVIIDGITYFKNMVDEIIKSDKSNEQLYNIVIIVEKYLCVNDNNRDFLKSGYTILQYLAKATFYQIIQRVFKINTDKDMNITDLDNAINIFKSCVGDIITKLKGYNIDIINI